METRKKSNNTKIIVFLCHSFHLKLLSPLAGVHIFSWLLKIQSLGGFMVLFSTDGAGVSLTLFKT